MKPAMNLVGVILAVSGLAACTTPHSPNQLSQKTVNYQCGPGGQAPLTVQYTFQGRDALSARIIYQNQVVLLPRATATNIDMVGNTFRSDNFTWMTEAFDYDTVNTARGDMLTREIVPETDLQQQSMHAPATGTPPVMGNAVTPSGMTPTEEVSNIIVRDCVPVSTASS